MPTTISTASPRKVYTRTHAVDRHPTVKQNRREHRRLMRGKWVKMGAAEFLRKLVTGQNYRRAPPVGINPWKDRMPTEGSSEEDMYDKFVGALSARPNLLPGYVVRRSDKKPDSDDPSKQRPDVGLFREEDVPEDGRPNWNKQVLHFEFKSNSVQDDPLNDDETAGDFEHVSNHREENRGQFISYSGKQYERQQRRHIFSAMVLGHRARLCRWDRSGAITTELFDYTKTRFLYEFLWRFSLLTPEEQGYDTTATPIRKDSPEADLMRQMAQERDELCPHVRRYFRESLEESWTWWKLALDVEVDNGGGGTSGRTASHEVKGAYLVGKPHFVVDNVAGRATRGYVALDCSDHQFVWLKDAWRVDHDGMQKEGDILEKLNELGIKNIPTLLQHGDILRQRTVSQDYWMPPKSDPTKENPLKSHRHYRLVVKEICRPMSDFINGKELLLRLWECLEAHKEVMERAALLHRDLSSGNLMLHEYEQGGKIYREGILCDWELSKALPGVILSGGDSPRQPDRTGTWQFLSVHSLNDASWTITIQDELESFFYVLLWFGIRYLRHNLDQSEVGDFMHYFFDEGETAGEDWKSGARKQLAMEAGVIKHGETQLKFMFDKEDSDGTHPYTELIDVMLQWFKSYYHVVGHSINAKKNIRPDRLLPQGSSQPTDDQTWDAATSSRRLASYRKNAAETLSKEREEVEQQLLTKHEEEAQKLASHKAMSEQWISAVEEWKWPSDDKMGDQVDKDFKAGEKKDGKGKLKRPATSQSGAALVSEAGCRARATAGASGSQRGAAPQPTVNAARPRTRAADRTSRSQRGAAPEPAERATLPRRSKRSAAPEPSRPRTRANAGAGRSKRPAPDPADDDNAPRRKRGRHA